MIEKAGDGVAAQGAILAIDGQEWGGPTDDVYAGLTVAADVPDDPLTQQDLYELHSHADQRDIQVLGDQDVIDAFGDRSPIDERLRAAPATSA